MVLGGGCGQAPQVPPSLHQLQRAAGESPEDKVCQIRIGTSQKNDPLRSMMEWRFGLKSTSLLGMGGEGMRGEGCEGGLGRVKVLKSEHLQVW